MTVELKPCPFCGDYVRLVKKTKKSFFVFSCWTCGAETTFPFIEEYCIKYWNRRVKTE